MNLLKCFSKLLAPFFRRGGFFKLRFSYGRKINFIKLLFLSSFEPKTLDPAENVVVVGTGMAALSVLKNLKLKGHTRVTVIVRDEAFGGKCVNYGCMPSEYFSAKQHFSPLEKINSAREVIAKLRSITEQGFRDLGFPMVQGEVNDVKGQKIILTDCRQIDFDRLILATGNRVPPVDLGEITPLEAFWDLQTEDLVIVSDHNVSSLSYAAIALDQGIKPTVVFTEKLALSHLPSFQYFQKLLLRKGAKIIFEGKSLERSGQILKLNSAGKKIEIPFANIIFNGMPILNLPTIDGQRPGIFDINFSTCSLSFRKDVYVIGDASGLLAASEAEFQARVLVDSWQTGKSVDMSQLQGLPFRLHGDPSLAMAGAPWTLLKKEWRSIDFKTLGWSLLHGEEGKLWYFYDKVSDKVEGIHICHRNASDLISLASVLIDFPLSDGRWFSTSVHPSSFEIFKVLIEDVENIRNKPTKSLKTSTVLYLPPLSQLHRSEFFQKNFSEEERKLAILDPAPAHYLALLLGIKSISKNESGGSTPLQLSPDGKYVLPNGDSFEYSFSNSSSVTVRMAGQSSTINFTLNDES